MYIAIFIGIGTSSFFINHNEKYYVFGYPTCFHSEYNKIPPFYDVPRDRESDVGFAFDLMTVSPGTLHLMPQIRLTHCLKF